MEAIGSSIMKSVWNGKNKKILFLVIFIGMILLPGCDDSPTRPGEGFYSYQGYRDWWRIPLRFPYQITLIDTFDYGTLEKYDPSSLIADPKCETVVENISAIGYDGKFAVFQQRNVEKPYGCLIYASGSVRNFATIEELACFIKLNYLDSADFYFRDQKSLPFEWKAVISSHSSHFCNSPCHKSGLGIHSINDSGSDCKNMFFVVY